MREREKILRSVKREDSVIIEGFRIAYNFTRPHESLNYNTPAEEAGIKGFGKGKEAWLKLILESALWQTYNQKQTAQTS